MEEIQHSSQECAATTYNHAWMVQDSDERFGVSPLARLPVVPLLEEGFQVTGLGGESELAGHHVHLNVEEGKTGRTHNRVMQVCWHTRVTRVVPRPGSRRHTS
jgi:hypothetical protein